MTTKRFCWLPQFPSRPPGAQNFRAEQLVAVKIDGGGPMSAWPAIVRAMKRVLADPAALADIVEALGLVAEAIERRATRIDIELALTLLAIECDRRLRARAEEM